MSDADEITILRVYPRPCEEVTVRIPVDTMVAVRKIAEARDMSPEALFRFYIGPGLRVDAERFQIPLPRASRPKAGSP